MNEVKDRVGFLREGLFAKYVVALVGLVVFVLAINGAMEIWITYRGIKSSVSDGMSREGGGDRQANPAIPVRPRAADFLGDARLLQHHRSAPRRLRPIAAAGAAGQPALAAQCPGPRTAPHDAPDRHARQQRRFLPRREADRNLLARHQFCAGLLPRRAAVHVDRAAACRRQHHRRRDRPRLPVGVPDRCPGRQGGVCLCHRFQGRRAGRLLNRARGRQEFVEAAAGLSRQQARRRGAGIGHRCQGQRRADHVEPGAETRLARVLRTGDRAGADADPRSTGADRAADRARPRGRDHRRHHHGAPHAGADHGAAGRRAASRRRRFRPPHRGEDVGRAGGAGQPVQRHGRPARRDLFEPRIQGEGTDAGSGAIDQRAQGARGSRPRGRLLARPQRRAAHGRRACAGNHPCRRGADLRL